jgi:hypothetical protein
MTTRRFRIVPMQEATVGPCACCGTITSNVRGEVFAGGVLRAGYHVRWSPQHLDEHCEWLLDMGESRDVPEHERWIVTLWCRSHRRWPGFMVVDPQRTSWSRELGPRIRLLTAREVVGTTTALEAYAIVDEIMVGDARVTALLKSMFAAEPSRLRRWLADRWKIGRRQTGCTGQHRAPSPAHRPKG